MPPWMSVEEAARATYEMFENPAASAMLADALLRAGRLEEGLEEYQRSGRNAPPDLLRSCGDAFLANGDFETGSDYYEAAKSEVSTSQYLRHWDAFLKRTRSVDEIELYARRAGVAMPIDKLVGLGDAAIAESEPGENYDYALVYAFSAYKAAGDTRKLIQLAERCRATKTMDREMTDFVAEIYVEAGARNGLLDLAGSIGSWADLAYVRDLYAKADSEAPAAQLIALGTVRENDGRYDEAIEFYTEAGAADHLRDLARVVIEAEHGKTGRVDLPADSRRLALRAFTAAASLQQQRAA